MDIKILKLITGEEILGEIFKDGTEDIKLKNPVGIAVVRGQDGMPNVGFTPFPLHAEPKSGEVVAFKREHVVYSYVPAEDFRRNYDSIFGLGLVLPGDKKIITG